MNKYDKSYYHSISISRNDAYMVAYELRALAKSKEAKACKLVEKGKCPGCFSAVASAANNVADELFAIVDKFDKEK